ncbi:MAG TPA: cation transporter [Anaerolineales bacterium]
MTENQQFIEVQAGVRIELISVAWMVIEMGVSIAAGILARSVLLTAFGIDSLIELASGGVLLWRLTVEARGGDTAKVERAEHRASWIVSILLALLCVYVLTSALDGLVARSKPEASTIGLAISVAALVIMPYLARVKRSVATRIQSAALAGDAVNSITCAYMAGTVLLGLALNRLLGWWWADDVAALLFLVWLARETLESFEEVRRDTVEQDGLHE